MKITTKQFNKLRKFKTASFAWWDFDNIQNVRLIERNVLNFHSDIVILGLNPADKMGFLKNFHYGRFDIWYREAFSKLPFKGCYMTDFISYPEVTASVMMRKWKNDNNKKFRDKNIRLLREQFDILKITKSTTFVCIGRHTENLFKEYFPHYTKFFYLRHPNAHGTTRVAFFKDVKKIKQ